MTGHHAGPQSNADSGANTDGGTNADSGANTDGGTNADAGANSSVDPSANSFEHALESLRAGEPILVHDAADREGETDLIYHADSVTPEAVTRLRNDAGGLVCVALGHDIAEAFDLPFYSDVIDHPATADHELGYDDRSSFSLTVNHRDTYTGITDDDRSTTIRALGDAAAAPEKTEFATESGSPATFTCSKPRRTCSPSARATRNSGLPWPRPPISRPPSSSARCSTTKLARPSRPPTRAPTRTDTASPTSRGARFSSAVGSPHRFEPERTAGDQRE